MTRVRDDIEPVPRLFIKPAFNHWVLAVHSGIPQMLDRGDPNERNLVELMLYGPDLVITRMIDDKVHPAVPEKWRGGHPRVGGARMLVGIQLLESETQLLEQWTAIRMAFKLL